MQEGYKYSEIGGHFLQKSLTMLYQVARFNDYTLIGCEKRPCLGSLLLVSHFKGCINVRFNTKANHSGLFSATLLK